MLRMIAAASASDADEHMWTTYSQTAGQHNFFGSGQGAQHRCRGKGIAYLNLKEVEGFVRAEARVRG